MPQCAKLRLNSLHRGSHCKWMPGYSSHLMLAYARAFVYSLSDGVDELPVSKPQFPVQVELTATISTSPVPPAQIRQGQMVSACRCCSAGAGTQPCQLSQTAAGAAGPRKSGNFSRPDWHGGGTCRYAGCKYCNPVVALHGCAHLQYLFACNLACEDNCLCICGSTCCSHTINPTLELHPAICWC